MGLETTLNRPVINTRDEPHARAREFRRLHVITGDANRSEYAGWLKVGTAALVLAAIEADLCADLPRLADPVAAMHTVSHDLTLAAALPLADDAGTITALALQQAYADRVAELLETRSDLVGHPEEAAELLAAWRDCLDTLARDPMELADRLDWVAKLTLLERYRTRDGIGWDAPKLALIDLQYAELDPKRSLYHALVAKGRMRRLFTDEEVERARTHPPSDTRAYFRGEVMRRYADQVVAASWDSLIVDVPKRRSLLRIPMLDPLRGTRAHVGAQLDASTDIGQLVTALGY